MAVVFRMRQAIVLLVALTVPAACVSTGLDHASPGPANAAEIARALDGGLIGRSGVDAISRSDRQKALEAEYRALEYMPPGQTVTWYGSGGLTGEVMAAQPYRVGSQDCRPYTHRLQTAAGPVTVRGTACRSPQGTWTPLS